MIPFLAGFIVGCMFATGAIFLFCAFATPKDDDSQDQYERASREV